MADSHKQFHQNTLVLKVNPWPRYALYQPEQISNANMFFHYTIIFMK